MNPVSTDNFLRQHPPEAKETILIIAVSFGSKSTSISYATLSNKRPEYDYQLGDIATVTDWPPREIEIQVPNKISYSPSPRGCRQWGYDIDDNSVVNEGLRVALEEAQDRTSELTELLKLVSTPRHLGGDRFGPFPVHLTKTADQIAIDFLSRVAEKVECEVSEKIGRRVLMSPGPPLDLVFTYPQWWDQSTKSRYHRVIQSSFTFERFPTLRHTYFVQELQAAIDSHFAELFQLGHTGLCPGDCFIVCQSSEDTSQSGLYRVASIDHDSRKVTCSSAGHAIVTPPGSSLVDKEFIQLLYQRLGPENAEKLELSKCSIGGNGSKCMFRPPLRSIIDRFQPIKHAFDGCDNGLSIPIQLPRGIEAIDDQARGLVSGTLSLTVNDIKGLFDGSITTFEDLIAGHIISTSDMNSPLKMILLSGTFVSIPYVFERIRLLCRERGIAVERCEDHHPMTSGAARHATGAVSARPEPVRKAGYHTGVVFCEPFEPSQHRMPDQRTDPVDGSHQAKGQIKWLIDKNDTVFPDSGPRYASMQFFRRFWQKDQTDRQTSRVVVVVSSTDYADSRPSRFVNLEEGKDWVLDLEYKLGDIPAQGIQKHEIQGRAETKGCYYRVALHVDLYVDSAGISAKLRCGSSLLAESETAGRLSPFAVTSSIEDAEAPVLDDFEDLEMPPKTPASTFITAQDVRVAKEKFQEWAKLELRAWSLKYAHSSKAILRAERAKEANDKLLDIKYIIFDWLGVAKQDPQQWQGREQNDVEAILHEVEQLISTRVDGTSPDSHIFHVL